MDSAYSGYATLLRRILLRNGLVAERDYELLPVGNTQLRTAAIQEGRAAGAMLGLSPEQGREAGLELLATGSDYVPLYTSNEFITTRRWAADNPHLLLGFNRALIETHSWLADPRNMDEAIASIMRTDNVDAARATRIYRTALDEMAGTTVVEQVRMDVVQSLVDLRAEVGLLPAPMPASRYVNPHWYALALESLGMRP